MQRKILLLVIVSIMVMLLSIGLVSYLSVHESINHSLAHHLTMSKLLGKSLDYVLERNITRLYDISITGYVDFTDNDWMPEKRSLRTAYEYSMFTDGVFLMDLNGNILQRYPHKDGGALNMLGIPYVQEALRLQKTVVSDVYTLSPTRRQVIFILVPLKDISGEVVGLAGGEVNPSNYFFSWIIKSLPASKFMKVELIDSHGIIITSNDPERTLTYTDHDRFLSTLIKKKKAQVTKCHRCHTGEKDTREADMLAFAPLTFAPWGVTVRQPESFVFGPTTHLKNTFFIIALIVIAAAVVLAVGMSRSIIHPIRSLGRATERIASGDLSVPVRISGGDEIEELAVSFEAMRVRLSDSLDRIRNHTTELEERVKERTSELLRQKKLLASLLDEGMHAQEDERKRIARELHDETSQTLAALGMSLEVSVESLRMAKLTPEMLIKIRETVSMLMDGINRLIHDLRPPVLDDLGLESAVRWLLQRHMGDKGIEYNIETSGLDDLKMNDKAELSFFRVIQESIINISKHAQARRVEVNLDMVDGFMNILVSDDGIGFNQDEVAKSYEKGSDHGFGLMGMKERVTNLGGEVSIISKRGSGTEIYFRIPVEGVSSDG